MNLMEILSRKPRKREVALIVGPLVLLMLLVVLPLMIIRGVAKKKKTTTNI